MICTQLFGLCRTFFVAVSNRAAQYLACTRECRGCGPDRDAEAFRGPKFRYGPQLRSEVESPARWARLPARTAGSPLGVVRRIRDWPPWGLDLAHSTDTERADAAGGRQASSEGRCRRLAEARPPRGPRHWRGRLLRDTAAPLRRSLGGKGDRSIRRSRRFLGNAAARRVADPSGGGRSAKVRSLRRIGWRRGSRIPGKGPPQNDGGCLRALVVGMERPWPRDRAISAKASALRDASNGRIVAKTDGAW